MNKTATLFLLTLLLGGTASAQSNDSLVVLWLTEPGMRPAAIFSDGFESGDVSRFDFDGDSKPELITTRTDPQGNLDGLVVVNAASLDTLWRVRGVGPTLGLAERDGMKLYGFADAFGTGTPVALLITDADAFAVRPADNTVVWSWRASDYLPTIPNEIRFLGAADLTDDGRKELVFALPETRQVQVLGRRD